MVEDPSARNPAMMPAPIHRRAKRDKALPELMSQWWWREPALSAVLAANRALRYFWAELPVDVNERTAIQNQLWHLELDRRIRGEWLLGGPTRDLDADRLTYLFRSTIHPVHGALKRWRGVLARSSGPPIWFEGQAPAHLHEGYTRPAHLHDKRTGARSKKAVSINLLASDRAIVQALDQASEAIGISISRRRIVDLLRALRANTVLPPRPAFVVVGERRRPVPWRWLEIIDEHAARFIDCKTIKEDLNRIADARSAHGLWWDQVGQRMQLDFGWFTNPGNCRVDSRR
jgi:hypothetical protein